MFFPPLLESRRHFLGLVVVIVLTGAIVAFVLAEDDDDARSVVCVVVSYVVYYVVQQQFSEHVEEEEEEEELAARFWREKKTCFSSSSSSLRRTQTSRSLRESQKRHRSVTGAARTLSGRRPDPFFARAIHSVRTRRHGENHARIGCQLIAQIATDTPCVIYDYGSRSEDTGLPRSFWYGMEAMMYFLRYERGFDGYGDDRDDDGNIKKRSRLTREKCNKKRSNARGRSLVKV